MKKTIKPLFLSAALVLLALNAYSLDSYKPHNKNFEKAVINQNISDAAYYIAAENPANKAKFLNSQNIDDGTALYYAVSQGNLELVKLLTENGADINLRSKGRFPLALAVKLGHEDIARYLASTGKADATSIEYALLESAGPFASPGTPPRPKTPEPPNGGSIELMKLFVSMGADIKKHQTDLLFRAVDNGNTEILNYLISLGADVNAKDKHYGRTVLFSAAAGLNFEIVKSLVQNKAGVNAKSGSGITPLFVTIRNFEDETLEEKNFEIINYLIQNGADLNIEDSRGETVLGDACRIGNFGLVELLVNGGADVNAVDVLPFSVERKGTLILSFIINSGAEVKSKSGAYALAAAANAGNSEAYALLKEHGAGAEFAGGNIPEKYKRFREKFTSMQITTTY